MKRIPRPQGLTFLSLQLSQNKITKSEVAKYLLKIYILNQYTINNEPCTIEQLSKALKINQEELTNLYYQEIANLYKGNQFEDVVKGMSLGSLVRAGEKIHEALGLHHENVQNLRSLQADNFKPYMAKDLNQALVGLTGAGGNLINLLKLLQSYMGTPKVQINQQFNGTESDQKEDILTIKTAWELIQNTNPNGNALPQKGTLFITDPAIDPKLSQDNIPEVRAHFQARVATDLGNKVHPNPSNPDTPNQ